MESENCMVPHFLKTQTPESNWLVTQVESLSGSMTPVADSVFFLLSIAGWKAVEPSSP